MRGPVTLGGRDGAVYLHDADVPAGAPCDRCGRELTGLWYAVRRSSGGALRADDVAALRVRCAAWCLGCADVLLVCDGALVPQLARSLAAHALGAREWAARYASQAARTCVGRDAPVGDQLAAWRAELMRSALVSPAPRPLDLVPVWWTEPLDGDQLARAARRRELADAFGVQVEDVQ